VVGEESIVLTRSGKPEDYIYEQKDIPQVVGYLAQTVDNMASSFDGLKESVDRLSNNFQTKADASRSEKDLYDAISRVNKAQAEGFAAIVMQRQEDRKSGEERRNRVTNFWLGVGITITATMIVTVIKVLGVHL
jgi:hypothetical protein